MPKTMRILHQGGGAMVPWGWVVFAVIISFLGGMFLFAFLEVSREAENKKRKGNPND